MCVCVCVEDSKIDRYVLCKEEKYMKVEGVSDTSVRQEMDR